MPHQELFQHMVIYSKIKSLLYALTTQGVFTGSLQAVYDWHSDKKTTLNSILSHNVNIALAG